MEGRTDLFRLENGNLTAITYQEENHSETPHWCSRLWFLTSAKQDPVWCCSSMHTVLKPNRAPLRTLCFVPRGTGRMLHLL